jgi:hypothetical protein
MSFICRVVIGYFDPDDACAQQNIAVTRPLDTGQVARLQGACDQAFGINLRLSQHLRPDGLLFIVDTVVRRDTYKAAAVAHGLFGMSAVDHAHWEVLFPAADEPQPQPEDLVGFFQSSIAFKLDEQQARQRAEESLQRMGKERDFRRGGSAASTAVRPRVAWRRRTRRCT